MDFEALNFVVSQIVVFDEVSSYYRNGAIIWSVGSNTHIQVEVQKRNKFATNSSCLAYVTPSDEERDEAKGYLNCLAYVLNELEYITSDLSRIAVIRCALVPARK